MANDIEKNDHLVKAKTSSLQKTSSNLVSRGLSDLALLDSEEAEIIDEQAKEFRPGDKVYILTPKELTEEQANEWIKIKSAANTFNRSGQYDRSIEYHNKAISLDSNYAAAYNCRGLAYEMEGDINMAITDFQKACNLGSELGCENLHRVLRER